MIENYVRVSEILSFLQRFDHIDQFILEAKKSLGTNVHDAIKDMIAGDFPCVSMTERQYLKSFEKWCQRVNPTFKVVEERFFDDKLRVTGKIDALATIQGQSCNILLDWKTSAQESKVVWPMQGHLYYYLLQENGIDDLGDRFLFIKLDKHGELPTVYEYKYDQNIMNRCFLEVQKFWDNHKIVDYNS